MLQKKMPWLYVLTLCITVVCTAAGCTDKSTRNMGMPAQEPSVHAAGIRVAGNPTFSDVPVYSEDNGLVWVPLEETAKSMDLDLHYTNARFTLGSTDPVFSIKVNDTRAFASDQAVDLPQAPKLFDHKPYMTTQALSALMGTPVNWNAQASLVMITPIDDSSLSAQPDSAPLQRSGSVSTDQIRGLAASAVNKEEVIRFAKQFSGTPYEFSAGPYEQTHTFDCSSYVQQVYAKFNVSLPRSSRAQSRVGQKVTREQLQPGDLMFFSTPGRFKSNRIVGHVGLYAGNGNIIHTYGKPGVTVSDFNGYWNGRFLFAKRVAG